MAKLTNILDPNIIDLQMDVNSKEEALKHLSKLLEKAGYVDDRNKFLSDIYNREKQGITGIGDGIAIPHGKSSSVKKIGLSIGKTMKAIPWESIDSKGVNLIFLFAVTSDNNYVKNHLKILSTLAGKLGRKEVTESLQSVTTVDDLIRVFEDN